MNPPPNPPPGVPGYPPAPVYPAQAPGGFTPPPAGAYQVKPATPTSTEAVLALVLSLVGMWFSCFPVSFVAIYFGMKARRQAREAGEPSGTNATLGLVGAILGGVFGGMWALFWLFYLLMFLGIFGAALFGAATSHP